MKYRRVCTAAAALAAATFCFAACNVTYNEGVLRDPPGQIVTAIPNDRQGYDYVFYVTPDAAENTVYDYMVALRADGLLQFESYEGPYGQYVTSVGGQEESYEGETSMYYWALFADFVTMDGVPYCDDGTRVQYDGVTYYYCLNGVSGMPAFGGHCYALVYHYTSW